MSQLLLEGLFPLAFSCSMLKCAHRRSEGTAARRPLTSAGFADQEVPVDVRKASPDSLSFPRNSFNS